MPETAPLLRGPIAPAPPVGVAASWQVSRRRSRAALRISDQSPLAKVMVRAASDGRLASLLGVPLAGTRRLAGEAPGEALLTRPGPVEWLVLAAAGSGPDLLGWLVESAAETGQLVSVLDVTHGICLIRVTGEAAPDLLARECALDLSDQVCPDGTALRSVVSRVSTDIIRDDRDGARSYLLACERSLGQYLFDSLLDAGGELAVDVTGFESPGTWPAR